jgi:acyl-CoA thioesterase FadM
MTHEKEIEIRWRDLDAFGHVNHIVFLTYLEEVRDEWLGSVLADPALVWGYVIARVEIDYRRELTLEDDVIVARCSLERLGTKSAVTRPPPRRRPCSSRATQRPACPVSSPTTSALRSSARH